MELPEPTAIHLTHELLYRTSQSIRDRLSQDLNDNSFLQTVFESENNEETIRARNTTDLAPLPVSELFVPEPTLSHGSEAQQGAFDALEHFRQPRRDSISSHDSATGTSITSVSSVKRSRSPESFVELNMYNLQMQDDDQSLGSRKRHRPSNLLDGSVESCPIQEYHIVLGCNHTPTKGTKVYRRVRENYVGRAADDLTRFENHLQRELERVFDDPGPLVFWYNAKRNPNLVHPQSTRGLLPGAYENKDKYDFRLATEEAILKDMRGARDRNNKKKKRSGKVFELEANKPVAELVQEALQVAHEWRGNDGSKEIYVHCFQLDLERLPDWSEACHRECRLSEWKAADDPGQQDVHARELQVHTLHTETVDRLILTLINQMGNDMVNRFKAESAGSKQGNRKKDDGDATNGVEDDMSYLEGPPDADDAPSSSDFAGGPDGGYAGGKQVASGCKVASGAAMEDDECTAQDSTMNEDDSFLGDLKVAACDPWTGYAVAAADDRSECTADYSESTVESAFYKQNRRMSNESSHHSYPSNDSTISTNHSFHKLHEADGKAIETSGMRLRDVLLHLRLGPGLNSRKMQPPSAAALLDAETVQSSVASGRRSRRKRRRLLPFLRRLCSRKQNV